MTELDDIDRHVIAALQADGRRPFVAVADELGISESVVRYRVQRLERAGILQVVGIADPLKIGFDLMALIGIKVHPGTTDAVCRGLLALPETSYVAAVAGQYDVFAEVVCRDTAHFQQLLNEQLHHIAGVASTESFLILEIHKMAYGWGAGDHGVPLAAPAQPDGTGPRHRTRSKGTRSSGPRSRKNPRTIASTGSTATDPEETSP